jgi:hypothetical protein
VSDLIGRFLSFEEHLGRGLVKFAYYVALFYLVVVSLYELVAHLFDGEFGRFLLVPFEFLLALLVLRVVAELVIAVLSIDDNLRGAAGTVDGMEAGLTPRPVATPSHRQAATATSPLDPQPPAQEAPTEPSEPIKVEPTTTDAAADENSAPANDRPEDRSN